MRKILSAFLIVVLCPLLVAQQAPAPNPQAPPAAPQAILPQAHTLMDGDAGKASPQPDHLICGCESRPGNTL